MFNLHIVVHINISNRADTSGIRYAIPNLAIVHNTAASDNKKKNIFIKYQPVIAIQKGLLRQCQWVAEVAWTVLVTPCISYQFTFPLTKIMRSQWLVYVQ